MERALVELWADIGTEGYWEQIRGQWPSVFVPFDERWPQPGFVGNLYPGTRTRVVVMGQNPRASNTARASTSDAEMFRLIRRHADSRDAGSLNDLFSMMRKFLLGIPPHRPAWKPITAARKHLCLQLEDIAYLNLIPLATYDDSIVPAFREVFARSTKRQLDLLKPHRIVVYGKGAYEKFLELADRQWDVRYIQQRNYRDAPSVRAWLAKAGSS